MSRFLDSLSSLVNGNADRTSKRDATERDAGATTPTTPLVTLNACDADAAGMPDTPPQPPRRQAAAGGRRPLSTEGAETVPSGALVPLTTRHKVGRGAASSRALNTVVRATTQLALSHVEPTPPPKTTRASQRSCVVLTQTEKLRLQIMQVQLRLRSLELYDGPIDGVMHADLVEAVRHFQILKDMRDSGVLTAGTLTALGVRTLD